MNRRDFLKFIPLIPVAIGLVKLPEPPESVTITDPGSAPVIPAPANGSYYTEEEIRLITPLIAERIEVEMLQRQVKERLSQRVREILEGGL